jgi:hypothetical protein
MAVGIWPGRRGSRSWLFLVATLPEGEARGGGVRLGRHGGAPERGDAKQGCIGRACSTGARLGCTSSWCHRRALRREEARGCRQKGRWGRARRGVEGRWRLGLTSRTREGSAG